MTVYNLSVDILAKYSNFFILILVNVFLVIKFLVKIIMNYIGTDNLISMIITSQITYYLFVVIYEYLIFSIPSDEIQI